ncbi:MAG: hypothetical protein WC369_02165 [Dehalococcoidales bacterium]
MDLLKWARDKGVFVKVRIGEKAFNPFAQKRTSAQDDILKKRKEREVSDGKDDV